MVGKTASYIDQYKARIQAAKSPRWGRYLHPDSPKTARPEGRCWSESKDYFSSRRMAIFGFVIIANMAFQQSIICHFTRDYWKTVSESSAPHYREGKHKGGQGYNKFVFGIGLSELDGLGSNSLFFSVRCYIWPGILG